MSDPTDTGQRNPLSSSTSHASGTSARSISVQPDQPPAVMSMAAQDEVAALAPVPHGEAVEPDDAEEHAEADPRSETEADSEVEDEASRLEAAGVSDEPVAPAKEQQGTAYEPETAAEFTQPSESAAEEFHAEDTAPNPEDQPLTSAVEISEDVSAFVDEPAQTTAANEPAYTADAAADDDSDSASPDTPSDEDAAPNAPLPNGAFSEATSELRAAARQTLADNEARQEKALTLFNEVSRRFTAALEEAGVDAARVTFKVMEFAQASLKNNLELAKSYTAARSVPDVFGLHAAYIARQFELLNAQAEELREITAKFALRSTAALTPPTDPTGKSLDD